MKKILVSQRIIENEAYPEQRDALDVRWAQFFSKVDLFPILVFSEYPIEKYFLELEVSGVLFTGGNDLPHLVDQAANKKRDSLERALLEQAQKASLPVLGVCHGMQFLAHYFGMELVPLSGHVKENHEVLVDQSSRYANALGASRVVNSFHNYGVLEPSEDFISTLRVKDGSVEAFEHRTLSVLGIMWHPERRDLFAETDLELFRLFF